MASLLALFERMHYALVTMNTCIGTYQNRLRSFQPTAVNTACNQVAELPEDDYKQMPNITHAAHQMQFIC